jgi:hypothetical protein
MQFQANTRTLEKASCARINVRKCSCSSSTRKNRRSIVIN